MFTGIIQSTGTVIRLTRGAHGAEMLIDTALPPAILRRGDSIAVDGCCQTITAMNGAQCHFHVLNETLSRTTFGGYAPGTQVNVEPALAAGERLGGHIVQGHVDCIGRVLSIAQRNGDVALTLARPDGIDFPMVEKGSIAINGVSLTIAQLDGSSVTVCIIPHTWEHTALRHLRAGARVNLEADIIGKYVSALLAPHRPSPGITMDQLRDAGF